MKKLSIEQAEPIRKKFAPDWEIRKGKYLYKKVAFDDYNQALRFFMIIEKPQIKLDHFADIGFFYNEVILMVYTHDVGGLTQLDFELALYIDKALKQMGARQLEEAMPYTGKSPQYKGKRLPTDDTADAKDITKKSKKVDMPDEPTDFDFGNVDKEKLKKVVAKLVPQLNHPVREKVIRARFGLPPFNKAYTLDEIAKALDLSPERVRQIEARAMRQLKHPNMSRELRPFLDHIEEKWSASYKKSINCSNPKGFSQKAHCAGRKKNEDKEDELHGFDPQTAKFLQRLKAQYPNSPNELSALVRSMTNLKKKSDSNDKEQGSDIDNLEKEVEKLTKLLKKVKAKG